MHIVRISEYVAPSPGGREVHVRELCRRQTARGHTVGLLYRVGGEPSWSFRGTQVLKRTSVWRRLPHVLVSTAFLAAALATVVRRRHTVDLVHFHGDYLEAVAAGAVRLVGVPSLLTLHGGLSPRVLRTGGFVYRFPTHVVAVSAEIVSELDEVGIHPRRITVQHSGVDGDIFYPPARSAAKPPLRLVVGSALIPLKDHETVLEAVRLLRERGLDVRLEIAGAGPERVRLESDAPPGTRFHGQLERAELGQLMRSCHVAVLASVDTPQSREGTPTFLMEAMACGLPFVSTDSGGIPRLTRRSQAGLVVPQRDPQAFARAVHALTAHEASYQRYRRAALAFAPRLDWDVVAERLDSLMGSIARSR